VPRGKHPLRSVGTRTCGRRGVDCVSDTREGSIAGIWYVRQSRETDATIGSSHYRRMLCHFERPMGFPTGVTTVRQIGVCRDVDIVVNGDIAADRRADIVRQDVLAASGSAIDTCVDGAEKHRVQRYRRTGRNVKTDRVFGRVGGKHVTGRGPAGW
jgi:hypothetical protein